MANRGIKINLSLDDFKPNIDTLPKYFGTFNKNNLFSIFINNNEYVVDKKILYQECTTIRKIINYKMSDCNNISLTIPNINDDIVDMYINICYGNTHILKNLTYKEIIDLLYVLDMHPLNNFKISDLEYYICSKYERDDFCDLYLENICQTYELKYLVLIIRNFLEI